MKKLLVVAAFLAGFIAGSVLDTPIRAFAAQWRHSIAGGLSGTTGVAVKVDGDGSLHIR